LWYFSSLVIEENIFPAHYDYIARFFTVLAGALAAFRFNAYLESKKSEYEKSKYYLEICSDNYDSFYTTLVDLNNSRVDWIYAARLLMETKTLEDQIISTEHETVLNIKKMKVRHMLLNQFQVINEENNTESPLPISFFYGIPNWREFIDTPDDAAYESMRFDRPATFGEFEVPKIERLPMLQEQSVYAVFEFLSYPEDFKNHLDKVNYSSDWPQRVKSFQGEGAYLYIKHRRKYVHPEKGISNEKLHEIIKKSAHSSIKD
jgi:hypothetical protein